MDIASRTELMRSAEDAMRVVRPGASVAVGGAITAGHPMTLLRALIRAGADQLTIIAPTAGLDVDLLVAAERVRKLLTAYVGAESIAAVGPMTRRAIESGEVELWEADEGHLVIGLQATAQLLPFLPSRGGVGTDLPVLNPDLIVFSDPIRGETLLAVPAIHCDVALISADASDRFGNVQFAGTAYLDRVLADAADHVIIQVERIVDNAEIRSNRASTYFWPECTIVEAPSGTHPFSSAHLHADVPLLSDYVTAARAAAAGDPRPLQAWIAHWVTEPVDHAMYLDRLTARRLKELQVRP